MTIEELDSAIRADVAAQDRRTAQRQPMRAALFRLQLAAFNADNWLPERITQELTAAIQGVVDLISQQQEAQ